MNVGVGHWLAALSVALLLHGALLAWMYRTPTQPPVAATARFEVSLTSAPRISNGASSTLPEIEEVPVTQIPEASPVAAQESLPSVKPTEILAPTPVSPPAPEVQPRRTTAHKARRTPQPSIERTRRVRPEAPEDSRTPQKASATPRDATSPAAAAAATAAARGAPSTPAARDAQPNPAALSAYYTQVRAWIEKRKEYPLRARLQRLQGTVVLHVEIDSLGRVLSHRVERSSGFPVLDRAAEDMLKRASPVPPIPSQVAETRLVLKVPISFALR